MPFMYMYFIYMEKHAKQKYNVVLLVSCQIINAVLTKISQKVNREDPDRGAAWSGSALFDQTCVSEI